MSDEGEAKAKKNKWLDKKVLVESEGLFCYGEGDCEKIVKKEFEKTKHYIDSIPILEGTEHLNNYSLKEVVGKVNDLQIEKINGKWWLTGKGHFDTEKVSPEFLSCIVNHKPIPGSVANYVEIEEGTQKNMLPTHFLMHPNLQPNIPEAGLVTNTGDTILFLINNKQQEEQDDMTEPEVKDLQKQVETLKAENAALLKTNTEWQAWAEAQETDAKAVLVKELVNTKSFTNDELKDLSLAELQAMKLALGKTKGTKQNPAVKVNAGQSLSDRSSVFDLYQKKFNTVK